jgi:hypothetical protein
MDFLTFKTFISTEALILFYYLGALVSPIGLWLFLAWLIKKYKLMNTTYEKGKELLWRLLSAKQKMQFVAFYILFFFFMELFWRMLFEFLIGYMQMRDALVQI